MLHRTARALRQRFYLEVVLGVASLLLFVLTLLWKDWIEIVFRVDPDGGNGAIEYAVCAMLVAAALTSWWFAATEWRRFRAPAPAG